MGWGWYIIRDTVASLLLATHYLSFNFSTQIVLRSISAAKYWEVQAGCKLGLTVPDDVFIFVPAFHQISLRVAQHRSTITSFVRVPNHLYLRSPGFYRSLGRLCRSQYQQLVHYQGRPSWMHAFISVCILECFAGCLLVGTWKAPDQNSSTGSISPVRTALRLPPSPARSM